MSRPGEPFGVYVHVPFCASRCDYCAFATWTDRDHLMAEYAQACIDEVRMAWDEQELPLASSIFFGGGTPSRLEGRQLADILSVIPRTSDAEVTVECNPEDASDELFERWRASGVNRVSFGVQSMVSHVLDGLGRRHGPDSVHKAVSMAGSTGFRSFNVDLIIGGAGESDADWLVTLESALSLDPRPPHLSVYSLTVEPGTPLAQDPTRHPDDDVQAHRYEVAAELLSSAGYHCYEVSNWSIPGHQCQHNRLYWEQGNYRGIGCAAHSHSEGRRWWNIRTPERYIAAVKEGRSTVASEELLSPEQRAFEALALALRTDSGVPSEALPQDESLDGLLERIDGRALLTVKGRLLANEVTARLLVPARSAPGVGSQPGQPGILPG